MNIPTQTPKERDNTAEYHAKTLAIIDAESVSPHRNSIQTNIQYRTEILLACRKCFETAEDKAQFSACMKGIRMLVAELSTTPKIDAIFLKGAELALLSVMEDKA